MKPITTKGWGAGVNKDQLPAELAPGVWSDCQNMRFRNGNAERVAGMANVITPSITPYFVAPYSSGATRYVAYAGLAKAYINDGSVETEITRKALPASQTVTAGLGGSPGKTITTASAHGLTVGAIVTTVGFTPSYYNATNAPVTVINSPTQFTYTATNGASASSVQGTYTVVDEPTSSTSNFTGAQDDKWTGGNFNGVLILNNPVNGLFFYDQAVSAKLHAFPNFTDTVDFARPFKNFIVHGGQTSGGTKYRHRFGWSDVAPAGSVPLFWTASATNLAGNVDLVSDGEIVDVLYFGEDLIVYKRDARYRARYIGGNDVFDFQLISGNSKDDGLVAANCAVNTPKGQVFLTDGLDVRLHVGGGSQSLVYGRMLKYLRGAIDSTNRKRSFLSVNPYTSEVWVCFPESGQSVCTKAALWNWEDDTWGLRDLSNITHAAGGELPTSIATSPRLLAANTTPKIALVDSGTTDFGSSYTSMLERQGMDFDTYDYKTVIASMPRFDGSTNFTASVFHGSAPTQDASPTYTSAQTYTHNTTTAITVIANSGRFIAWKVTMNPSDTPSLRTIDFFMRKNGSY